MTNLLYGNIAGSLYKRGYCTVGGETLFTLWSECRFVNCYSAAETVYPLALDRDFG